MAQQAQVTSVEAIEAFRADLIVYLTKARPALEEISGDILRMRQWLQHEQRRHWENELRIRTRRLDEAKAELFNAKISLQHSQATTLPQMAVQRAQHLVREAEAKLAILNRWDHEMENRTAPMAKQLEQLHGFLTTDMKRAVAYLGQAVKTLDAYMDVSPTASSGSSVEPGIDSGAATPSLPSEPEGEGKHA
jgi:hypothetical protein